MPEQSADLSAREKTLSLLLVSSDDPAAVKAVQALVANAEPPVEFTLCQGIDTALAQDVQTTILLPVRLPLDHLTKALRAGQAPEVALDAWRDNCEALLRRCRKARRRMVMIDAGMLEAQPAACAQALGDRLGVRLAPVAAADAPSGSDLSPIHSAIAATLLAQDSSALELTDELEAMITGPISPRTPGLEDISAAVRNAASLTKERDLLQENLQQMFSETQRLVAEKGEHEKKLDSRANELSESQIQETQLATITEERDLLRESLQQMLTETERLMAEKSELDSKTQLLNAEIADRLLLKAQLDAINRQFDEARESHRLRESVLGAVILRLSAQAREHRAQHAQERDRLTSESQSAQDETV
ncbi:MAG: hypothetical protein JJT95_15935 [Pararhodobacter sp.]|nr:hypothetical protein [Pararhodobacter sp.]